MNECQQCGKNSPKPLRKIPVKKGKQIVLLDVCDECFNKAV